MKVKDTLRVDKIFQTLDRKIINFLGEKLAEKYRGGAAARIIHNSFPGWQYTGVAPFDDILDWCEQQFGDNFVWNYETIYFRHERDRTAFLLRWA